jgi:hypothetical protein
LSIFAACMTTRGFSFFSNLNKGLLKSLFLNNKYGGDVETAPKLRIPVLLAYSPIVVELREEVVSWRHVNLIHVIRLSYSNRSL